MSEMKLKIQELFSSASVDGVFLDSNDILTNHYLQYFTQTPSLDYSFKLFLSKSKSIIFCSPLELTTFQKEFSGFEVQGISTMQEYEKTLHFLFDGKTIGMHYSYSPYSTIDWLKQKFPSTQLKNISKELDQLREVKTKIEIEKITNACKISEQVFSELLKEIKVGVSERELAQTITIKFIERGCENAFPPIVAFGKNAFDIHHINTDRKLKKNEEILLDFGARYQGYCADISRTIFYGSAGKEFKSMYKKNVNALESSIVMMKPGVEANKLFQNCEAVLERKLLHSLGHGIGLQVHDLPQRISASAEWKLSEGMCLAVEPGIYEKSFGGIRTEDNVLVTKNGIKRLTKNPEKLIEL